VLGVAPAPALHADKAKRFRLTDGRRDGVVMNAIVHEVLLRNREVAVRAATVAGVLDLNPGYNAMGGHTQHSICR
jgi:hypothetical protein